MRKKVYLLGALLLLGGILLFSLKEKELLIRDQDTGEIYGSFDVEEGDVFSITFIHSVNKSPVTDRLIIRGHHLDAYETIYSSFGAGVQTELREGEELSYDKDGNMVIRGFQQSYGSLNLIVGTVSDHILTIHGKEISLRELCGRNASVAIVVK
ncbi:DUF1850 domain-containing protein [Proteiniclasticum sp. SCR006]|uniref:DUF1850 domain-containing protein n=1 Tax=Proteiniclasticum aestuarii TaxID=2817862 RepID=A0A939KHK9_9CLOT|nr:DUF1850 domain-containing protein [Proteiniclasticum aestuarii]MBO1265604.1 DUF1850 domain-containing protein [Proteiniclasticum aestuarii]